MQRYLPIWDYLISLSSFYASFWLHFVIKKDYAIFRFLPPSSLVLFFAPLLLVLLYAFLGMYSQRSRSRTFSFTRLTLSALLTIFIFTTFLFYFRAFAFPRLIIVFWTGMNFLGATLIRIPILEKWKEERLFVLYRGTKGGQLFQELYQRETPSGMVLGGTDIDTFTREDLCQYLRHVIKDFDLDRVVLLLSPDERQDLVSILEEEGIPYDLQSVLSFFEQKKGQVKLYFADLLDYKQIIAQNPYLTLKYLLDRIVSSIFLVVLAPLFGVIALLIFLDSPGPILYWQTRVGQGGKIFSLCKFRTMIPDAEKHTGAVLAQKNDPRVTRIGKFLRKTRLDELPQLWNVLRGEMSLVGPRPERPEFVERWKEIIPHYEARLLTKPGITGWAQVRGKYDEGPETVWEKLEYDLYYLRHLSLSFDLEIIVHTLTVMLFGKGAR